MQNAKSESPLQTSIKKYFANQSSPIQGGGEKQTLNKHGPICPTNQKAPKKTFEN